MLKKRSTQIGERFLLTITEGKRGLRGNGLTGLLVSGVSCHKRLLSQRLLSQMAPVTKRFLSQEAVLSRFLSQGVVLSQSTRASARRPVLSEASAHRPRPVRSDPGHGALKAREMVYGVLVQQGSWSLERPVANGSCRNCPVTKGSCHKRFSYHSGPVTRGSCRRFRLAGRSCQRLRLAGRVLSEAMRGPSALKMT